MCLLIQQTKETTFSDTFLRGVYARNADGIGVMWAENGELHYHKHLPVDAADAIAFYRTNAQGRDCCVHFRMKTHGHIDYENCHPYPVFGFEEEHEHPMLLMHNGVLSCGNARDTTKSDTWHFIRDHLRPLLAKYPDLMFEQQLVDMLGKYIGNNRFAVMDYAGRVAIVNRNQGVTYEGAWLSNTYAWDYSLHPDYKAVTNYSSFTRSAWPALDDTYPRAKKQQPALPAATTKTTKPTSNGSKTTGRGKQKDLPLKSPRAAELDLIREEIQQYMDAIAKQNADVYEIVTFEQVRRLMKTSASIHSPWDLLDYWETGECPDDTFLDVLKGKLRLNDVLDELHDIAAYETIEQGSLA
jgi:predicted glutamine amidotransferase